MNCFCRNGLKKILKSLINILKKCFVLGLIKILWIVKILDSTEKRLRLIAAGNGVTESVIIV